MISNHLKILDKMKIKLIPVSHPELDIIEIDSDVFLIGRLEDPFISFDPEVIAELSRHHAKIFQDNNQLCIVDLESLNGTTLNDLTLGTKPLPVNDGDVIEFARQLAYKVEIVPSDLEQTRYADEPEKISLKLEPIDKASGLDTLVITSFPFLISKEAGVFSSFLENHPSETSKISRRHAYINVENNALKLIDISSTNGTFLNNKALENEQPEVLKNGDIVSFAGNFFTYVVNLGPEIETVNEVTIFNDESIGPDSDNIPIDPDTVVPGEIESKTTFVNEPSPFLDILCDEVEQNRGYEENSSSIDPADKSGSAAKKKKPGILSFIQQGKFTLADKKSGWNSKKIYLIFLVLVLVGIAAGITYFFLNDENRDIKALLNSGKYANAVALTQDKLKSDPGNSTLLELSTKAVLNTFIPVWLASIEQEKFKQGIQVLGDTKASYLNNPEIVRSIDLLQWSGNIHQFIATRNESKTIVIFKDENEMNALLAPWDNNAQEIRKNLAMIASIVPSFKAYYEQLLSDIGLLENERDLYLKAIATLKTDLLSHLKNGKIQALIPTVTQFENNNTSVTGLDDLKLDIYQYNELNDAINDKDITRISALHKKNAFKTPIFIAFSEQVFKDQLPPEPFTSQYAVAINAWQTGEIEKTMTLLMPLSKSKWGPLAETKLKRYQIILNEYSALEQARGSQHYVEKLFDFHAQLSLPEDGYFLKRIDRDFQDNKKVALEKAKKSITRGNTYWRQYKGNNGIGGLLRLENTVSKTYKTQANNLNAAFKNMNYSLQIYNNLHMDAPNDIRQLSSVIGNEIENQRKWLLDLELILPPEVLKNKLDLLDNPQD